MQFQLDLNTVWFILVGVLLAGYAILDGFDLGVGSILLFAKKDEHRRLLLNSVGPVWDGNEVWLLTGGGALFAAFPEVYATVFSGLYTALMLLLAVLILRAMSIEFRSKKDSQIWRNTWDTIFSVSSIVIAVLLGVALGNMIIGIPLDAHKEYVGTFFTLLNPYSLLVGLTTLALFMLHGTIYAIVKTEGELQDTLLSVVKKPMVVFGVLYILLTAITIWGVPHVMQNFHASPLLYAVGAINLIAVLNIPRALKGKKYVVAFISTSLSILLLMALFAIGMYPNIVNSVPNPQNSLNIYNSSSSQKTLQIMLIIALIGVPLVLAYTIGIYRVFRGKVKLDQHSY